MLLLLQRIQFLKKAYHQYNFHKHTYCDFQEIAMDDVANIPINYKSKSGSSYAFTNEGVYRISNHWGRAANCKWQLISNEKIKSQTQKCGFAKWTDFYPNNETEKLFYIEVNWDTFEVNFQHKNNPQFNRKSILRTANQTAKRIQTIKEVVQSESWAKYLDYDDISALRKDIISLLINTDATFIKIKQDYVK